MQRHGYYASLRDVRCECGHTATTQVQVTQFNANGSQITSYMPLCGDCYQLWLEDEQPVRQAA